MSSINCSCDGLSFDPASRSLIPSNDTLAIATYGQGSNITSLEVEPRYEALVSCCHSNNVSKIDNDCVLWCNLPPQYVNDTDGFADCFKSMASHYYKEQNKTGSGGFFNVFNSTSQDNGNGGDTQGGASYITPSAGNIFTLLTLLVYFAFLG